MMIYSSFLYVDGRVFCCLSLPVPIVTKSSVIPRASPCYIDDLTVRSLKFKSRIVLKLIGRQVSISSVLKLLLSIDRRAGLERLSALADHLLP